MCDEVACLGYQTQPPSCKPLLLLSFITGCQNTCRFRSLLLLSSLASKTALVLATTQLVRQKRYICRNAQPRQSHWRQPGLACYEFWQSHASCRPSGLLSNHHQAGSIWCDARAVCQRHCRQSRNKAAGKVQQHCWWQPEYLLLARACCSGVA